MATPPTFSAFSRIEDRFEEIFTQIAADVKSNDFQKAEWYSHRITVALEFQTIHCTYARNMYRAIELDHNPDDVVESHIGPDGKAVWPYIPLETLRCRLRAGVALDKEIIRAAWAAERDKAIAEFNAFGGDNDGPAAKRSRAPE